MWRGRRSECLHTHKHWKYLNISKLEKCLLHNVLNLNVSQTVTPVGTF